jgi:hypothetical protein
VSVTVENARGTWSLVAHPDHPPVSVWSVEVEMVATADGLRLKYRVEGAGGVMVPERVSPARTDGLWKATCFELFVLPDGAAGYVEFNFSPSTQWAAYRFYGYREGMRDLALTVPPSIRGAAEGDGFALEVDLTLHGLALDVTRIGLSAVIAEAGAKSFWALGHAAGAPDFHDRDCFTARLAAPEAP